MKTSEILQKLENGVKSLMCSDEYKTYLRFLASFRQYSFRNTVLIFSQCPHASLLAPYREWQSRHRHVRRGEKGIAVIAPHTYKKSKGNGSGRGQARFPCSIHIRCLTDGSG